MGFIKGIRLNIVPLWAPNDGAPTYTKLVPYNNDPALGTIPVWQGGTWFPTSSVQIEYNIFEGNLNLEEIKSLFFLMAPIHLVLSRLIPTVFSYYNIISTEVESATVYERGEILGDLPSLKIPEGSSIIKAGVSQPLIYSNPLRHYFYFQNNSTNNLYISELGNATIGAPSILVLPNGGYWRQIKFGIWTGPWYVIGSVAGQSYTVIER